MVHDTYRITLNSRRSPKEGLRNRKTGVCLQEKEEIGDFTFDQGSAKKHMWLTLSALQLLTQILPWDDPWPKFSFPHMRSPADSLSRMQRRGNRIRGDYLVRRQIKGLPCVVVRAPCKSYVYDAELLRVGF